MGGRTEIIIIIIGQLCLCAKPYYYYYYGHLWPYNVAQAQCTPASLLLLCLIANCQADKAGSSRLSWRARSARAAHKPHRASLPAGAGTFSSRAFYQARIVNVIARALHSRLSIDNVSISYLAILDATYSAHLMRALRFTVHAFAALPHRYLPYYRAARTHLLPHYPARITLLPSALRQARAHMRVINDGARGARASLRTRRAFSARISLHPRACVTFSRVFATLARVALSAFYPRAVHCVNTLRALGVLARTCSTRVRTHQISFSCWTRTAAAFGMLVSLLHRAVGGSLVFVTDISRHRMRDFSAVTRTRLHNGARALTSCRACGPRTTDARQ